MLNVEVDAYISSGNASDGICSPSRQILREERGGGGHSFISVPILSMCQSRSVGISRAEM